MIEKRMKVMLIIVGSLFGLIFLYKAFGTFMMNRAMRNKSHAVSVATMKVEYAPWEPKIHASGSVRAIHGVNVTTQLAGMVTEIKFTPGQDVTKNTLLVQLNAEDDIALLDSLKANAYLAQITYERDKRQYRVHAVSKQVVDNDAANLKSLKAQVAQQAAIVAKKSIRAPFTGRLGINYINPGQFINPGDNVVSLQTLDPIYVDFYVPQQQFAQLKVGQAVILTTDAYPGQQFKGTITTINPALDITTRNVEVEATIQNPEKLVQPGMFASVDVVVGAKKDYLTLPQTAISFNSYGNLVYIIRAQGKDKRGNSVLIANQHFVVTGEERGEQIQVISGLKQGDEIVSSGQLKLNNGSEVVINNDVQLPNSSTPKLKNNH